MQTNPLQLPDLHQMLTEQDAADVLCQSVRTLQKWRVNGFGPSYFKIGRSVRYRRDELTAWIESRRRAHTSQILPDDTPGPQCA
jgi:predicted DNA-binding transcriptional regulator AlpA